MKRVIYLNCFVDPWVEVVKNLRDKYGFEPVYWVGYNEDGSSSIVPKEFPNIIYQWDLKQAWRGLFPEPIASLAKESYLDVDFLREYASYEQQAIKMLDRLDNTRYCFNFMERQRFVRNLFKSWNACIDYLRPDMVITPMLPHRVYDYTLYLLCKSKKIPFIAFDHTRFKGRYILLSDIFDIGDMFVDDYKKALSEHVTVSELSDDIRTCFLQNKQDYSVAKPAYMTSEDILNNHWSRPLYVCKMTLALLIHRRKQLFGKDGYLNNWWLFYYKDDKDKPIEDDSNPISLYLRNRFNAIKYLKQLKNYYDSLTEQPDYEENYVVYFMHYQPEATTSPTGDIFVDQSLCINQLLKYLPRSYKVYVKEHPHQFFAHREGYTSRIKEQYSDLKKNPRVKLIKTEESSFDLIEHCKAIATVCGTVGWESIVRGKPVILFGVSWYENYDKGVLRIKDEKSGSQMTEFIEEYQYDENSLLAYLKAVGDNTKCAYYYKSLHKNDLQMSEQECVDNMVESIVTKYNDILNKSNVHYR